VAFEQAYQLFNHHLPVVGAFGRQTQRQTGRQQLHLSMWDVSHHLSSILIHAAILAFACCFSAN
jgi:hypothetical protein